MSVRSSNRAESMHFNPAGLSYESVRNMTLDLVFTFIKGFIREGSYEYLPPLPAGTFSGEYESTACVPSLGVSVRF